MDSVHLSTPGSHLFPPSLPPLRTEQTPVDGGYEALIRRIYESVRAIHAAGKSQAKAIESVSDRVDALDESNQERAASRARLLRLMAWGLLPVLTAIVGSVMWVGGSVRDSMAAQNREQAAAVARAVASELATELSELRRHDLEQRASIYALDKELSARIDARPLPREIDAVRAASRPREGTGGERSARDAYGF
jgi:hypothetical protein